MSWRLAHSLEKLRLQVNAKWPNRSKDSDGSIGNAEHSARESDHNPDQFGVVRAIDITHDIKDGFDSYAFADLVLKKQDRRLKYVISNRRIGSGPFGVQPGVWRPYRVPPNKNPHDHHCHISCVPREKNGRDLGDDTSDWDIDGMLAPSAEAIAAHVAPPPTLRHGDHGPQVQTMQGRLNAHGAKLMINGNFDDMTLIDLKAFQKAHGLFVDGVCGAQSWKALA